MYIHKELAQHVLLPLVDLTWKRNIGKYLQELEQSQWYTREQLEEIQQKKLKALLKHAYDNVPYYRAVFKERKLTPADIAGPKDLPKLPVLTKEDIRNNFTQLLAGMHKNYNPVLSYTGGSTGEPMGFYKDRDNILYNEAANMRAREWAGVEFGDKLVVLWGHPNTADKTEGRIHRFYSYLSNRRILNTFNMGSREMEQYIELMRKFKPKAIRGFTSAIYSVARHMEEAGIDDIHPQAVITTGENLLPFQRDLIERQFDCKVFDTYSGGDHRVQICECEQHAGYHIAAESGIVEVTKKGEPVPVGERGDILITELCNYSMPFIRYSNGDIGALTDEPCSCGRGLPMMKTLEGRNSEMLLTSDGRAIAPAFMTYLFYPGCVTSGSSAEQYMKIKEYQVVQEADRSLRIKIVKGPSTTEREFEYIIENFQEYFGADTKITLEFVESIPALPSGKKLYFINCNLNKEGNHG
jgi:phenylacetate-CoA ligase